MKRTLFLILITLLLTSCSSGLTIEEPQSVSEGIPAEQLELETERTFDLEGAYPVNLSPNGQFILVAEETALCLYDSQTLKKVNCVDIEGRTYHYDLGMLKWAADNTRVVFSESYVDSLLESDIWLADFISGTLTNLTEDPYSGKLDRLQESLAEDEKINVDYLPMWKDGQTIIFSRSYVSAEDFIESGLYTISLENNEISPYEGFQDELAFVLHRDQTWLPEQNTLLFTYFDTAEDSVEKNGVWSLQEGSDAEQMLGKADNELGPPILVDVDSSESLALVVYPDLIIGQENETSPFRVFNLADHQLTTVKESTSNRIEFVLVTNAIFSPDGSKLAYIYTDLSDNYHLCLKDIPSGEEVQLMWKAEPIGVNRYGFGGLYWADNDLLMASTQENHAYLVNLAVKE